MKISFKSDFSQILDADLMVLIAPADATGASIADLPSLLRDEFEAFREAVREKKAKAPKPVFFNSDKGIPVRVRFTSLNFHASFPPTEQLKIAAADAWQDMLDQNGSKIAFILAMNDLPRRVCEVVEGVVIGSYRYVDYKSEKNGLPKNLQIVFLTPKQDLETAKKAAAKTQQVAELVNETRTLVNTPGRKLVPADLARYAKKIAVRAGLECEVLTEKQLEKEGYNGLITVGCGSKFPPRMIILRYNPVKAVKGKHLCMVGKGITFDTGGISLKPPLDMWEMKEDMAGAAAVLHAIEAIALAKAPIKVTAILVSAENAISASAVIPGEVFTAKNGKTVHVMNTDAEGRLVLTDGFYRAGKEKATHIVDVATLTGGALMALGTSISAILGNTPDFSRQIISAGTESGEDIWELPLYEEYRQWLKSCVADLDNISAGRYAQTIIGGLFLSEFVPENTKWAHLDIAPVAFTNKKWRYYSPGATGAMVRTLARLAESLAKE